MDGKKPVPLADSKDFTDPFNAGQMVGMLVMITFLEKQKNIPGDAVDKLKWVCANNASIYLEKPTEDIFLLINNIVKEM